MDHHRSVDFALILVRTTVFQVESLRELEIELDGGALVGTFESVLDGDVDLGSVECSVTWIDFPLSGLKTIEGVAKLLLLPSDGWRIRRREKIESSARYLFEPYGRGKDWRQGHTRSASSHVSIVPRYFSGLVDSSSLNWKPNRP